MKKSHLISLVLTLAITAWMLAGRIAGDSTPETRVTVPSASADGAPMTVAVRTQHARDVERHIVAQGQVEPNRLVTVRAETAGRIARVVAQEGQPITANAVIAVIAADDRPVRLKKAEALLDERQRAHQRIQQLVAKGHQASAQLDESLTALKTAEADLEAIRIEIEKTTIRAPFDGILEMRQVELGDYVDVNGEIATIVDNNPLVVTVQIAQQDIGRISAGNPIAVAFATGQRGVGSVRYIAPRAEPATRTFRVEVAVPNPGSLILSGTSAEARIPTGTVAAQFVSSALLGLDDDGVIGIKTVSADNVVEFNPVDIVLSEQNGVWVSGLPQLARIIAVGHGFVRPGQLVSVVDDKDSASIAQASAAAADAAKPSL